MTSPVQKMIIGGLIAAIALVVAYWALLFFAQRSMLFPRPPASGTPQRPPFADQIWLTTSFGRVEAWYLPPIGAHSGPAPLLLFTHGNGELIDYWPEEIGLTGSRRSTSRG